MFNGSGSRARMTGSKGSGSRPENRSFDYGPLRKLPGFYTPGLPYPDGSPLDPSEPYSPAGPKPKPRPAPPSKPDIPWFDTPSEPGGGNEDGVRRNPGEDADSIKRRRDENRRLLELERKNDRKPKPGTGPRGRRGGKKGKGKGR